MTSSDSALTSDVLDQFLRSLARPEHDRVLEERADETRERGRRMFVRAVVADLDFLEVLYRFLHADVRLLEQRLDEIHVLIDRRDFRGVPGRLEVAQYKHGDALAARNRLVGYLAQLNTSVERIEDVSARDGLRGQSLELRRRVKDLLAPVDIAGARLNRYVKHVTDVSG